MRSRIRFKLHSKLVILCLIAILCFVTSMIFLIVFSNKKLEEYVLQEEVQGVRDISNDFATFYSENGGWNSLKENPVLWNNLLEKFFLKRNYIQVEPSNSEANNLIVIATISQNKKVVTPLWDQLMMGPRLSLFDEHHKYIIGTEYPNTRCSFIEIELDHKVIGWLGLAKGPKIYQPIETLFNQNKPVFFITMGVIFFFNLVCIALLFSKHFLKPITQLVSATDVLGRFNFDVQIPIKSSDEIGELAMHFNIMTKKLMDYERNQKQWLGDISHELRTPLSVLICEIDAMTDGIRKPNKKLLLSLGNEIRHLIKLVNDIHEISLIETDNFIIEKKHLIKPLPLLGHEIYLFEKHFKDNNISTEVDLDPAAYDLQINGDDNLIMQLFSNILENAIRYIQKPGNLIIRQTNDADHIKFIFEDSGPGVPDQALPLLFNRLYRVEPSRSRKTGGSGLGLAICKSIVEMHEGKIRAENIQGGGLMIEISLPLEHNQDKLIQEQSYIEEKAA